MLWMASSSISTAAAHNCWDEERRRSCNEVPPALLQDLPIEEATLCITSHLHGSKPTDREFQIEHLEGKIELIQRITFRSAPLSLHPPWIEGVAEHLQATAAARGRHSQVPRRRRENGLIIGDAELRSSTNPPLLPPEQLLEEDETSGAPDPADGNWRPTPSRHAGTQPKRDSNFYAPLLLSL